MSRRLVAFSLALQPVLLTGCATSSTNNTPPAPAITVTVGNIGIPPEEAA